MRLSLLPLLLLAACPEPAKECADTGDCDTGFDTSLPDTDDAVDTDRPHEDTGDIDIDSDAPPDTGIAVLYYVGEFNTRAGEFVDAYFGYGFWGLTVEDWACRAHVPLPYEGPAPAGCPDCDWSFDLGPGVGSIAIGDDCADFGIHDGDLDGTLDYSWGFASIYEYDYSGSALTLENTLLVYADSWFPVAFNYGGSYSVYGDAEHVEVSMLTRGSYYYYYYYR